jgi:hypothetical protein
MTIFSTLNKWSDNVAHKLLTDFDGKKAPSRINQVKNILHTILKGETPFERRKRNVATAIKINVIANAVLTAIGMLLQPLTFVFGFALGAIYAAVPSLNKYTKELYKINESIVNDMDEALPSKKKMQIALITAVTAPIVSLTLAPTLLGFGAGFAVTEMISR